jgi:hypothetical protein
MELTGRYTHRKQVKSGILLHRKGKLMIAKSKSLRLSCSVIVSLPYESILCKISKYEGNLSDSVVLYFEFTRYIKWIYLWKLWLLTDRTSSIYLNVWLKDMTSILLLSCNSFWTNYASYEYKNNSVNKGAQFVPIGIPTDSWKAWSPKTTKILYTRKPSIPLMSAYSTCTCVGYQSFASQNMYLAFKSRNICIYGFLLKNNYL